MAPMRESKEKSTTDTKACLTFAERRFDDCFWETFCGLMTQKLNFMVGFFLFFLVWKQHSIPQTWWWQSDHVWLVLEKILTENIHSSLHDLKLKNIWIVQPDSSPKRSASPTLNGSKKQNKKQNELRFRLSSFGMTLNMLMMLHNPPTCLN